ncbi:MAG: hypothetical protein WC292_03755 [Clostridia bacterium]
MDTVKTLKKFNAAIDAFFSSRLIIVEGTIRSYLELVADESELLRIISESAKNNAYALEYKKAVSRDGVGGFLTIPSNRRQLITLVTGLLYEFDAKTLSVIDFVTRFFPAETSHESYRLFCEKVIMPYADAFRYMLEGEPRELSEAIAEELAIIPYPDKAKEDTDFWLYSLLDIVVGDNSSTEENRREYVAMIKGLLYVSETRNPMLIKTVWIGLKNTLGFRKPFMRELKEIEMILKSYGVID